MTSSTKVWCDVDVEGKGLTDNYTLLHCNAVLLYMYMYIGMRTVHLMINACPGMHLY